MSSLNYYTITLTPENRFFFGGEVTFGQAGDAEKRRSSYLVKSRVLPQQTSLLGMLRYELLREASLLAPYTDGDGRQDQATALVGNTGFVADDTSAYGTIQALSPILLTDGKHLWCPEPLDDGAYEDKKGKHSFAWRGGGDAYWKLKNYNPKKARYARFVRDDGAHSYPLDDCFAEVPLVGNRISNRLYRPGETSEEDEEGLFRQTFRAPCRKKAGTKDTPPAFAFVFRVATTGNVLDTFLKQHEGAAAGARRVFLGGERSAFMMDVAKAEDLALVPAPTYRINTSATPGTSRIVLTSDCFLPADLLEKCQIDRRYFLLANVKSFRFLSSRLDQATDFASLHHKGTANEESETPTSPVKPGQRTESDLYQLAERGGVLLVPDEETDAVVSAIEGRSDLHTIGYNHCAVASLTPKV